MYYYDAQSGKWLLIRQSKQYRQRRKILRDLWLILSCAMLFLAPAFIIVFSLLATFLSFMFLDEVQYERLTP